MCNCEALKVGDRVFYTDNGDADTGTVRDITEGKGDTVYGVDWDILGGDTDVYLRSQLTKINTTE
jgi:hypothetical protein